MIIQRIGQNQPSPQTSGGIPRISTPSPYTKQTQVVQPQPQVSQPAPQPTAFDTAKNAVTSVFSSIYKAITTPPKPPEPKQTPIKIEPGQSRLTPEQFKQSGMIGIPASTPISSQDVLAPSTISQKTKGNAKEPEPTILDVAQGYMDKLFGITPEERAKIKLGDQMATAQNAYVMKTQYPELSAGYSLTDLLDNSQSPFAETPSQIVSKQVLDKIGINRQMNSKELTDVMMALSLPASFSLGAEGLAPSVLTQLKALGKFTAVSVAVDTALKTLTGKSSFRELLPEGTPGAIKDAVSIVDFLGKAYISHGLQPGKLLDVFTKETLRKYNAPEKVYLSGDQIKNIFQDGKLTTAQQKQAFTELGLDGSAVKKLFAKEGITIEMPTENVTRVVDRPWWAKVKELLKVDSAETVKVEKTPARIVSNEPGAKVTIPDQKPVALISDGKPNIIKANVTTSESIKPVAGEKVYYRGDGGKNKFAGVSSFVKGTNYATDIGRAKEFGSVKEYVLKPDAKVIKIDTRGKELGKIAEELGISKQEVLTGQGARDALLKKGYDAIEFTTRIPSKNNQVVTDLVSLKEGVLIPKSPPPADLPAKAETKTKTQEQQALEYLSKRTNKFRQDTNVVEGGLKDTREVLMTKLQKMREGGASKVAITQVEKAIANIDKKIVEARTKYRVDPSVPMDEKKTIAPGELNSRAIRKYGLTNVPESVGFITPEGKLIDSSGKKQGSKSEGRNVDHREIAVASIPSNISTKGMSGSDALSYFMEKSGSTRINVMPSEVNVDTINQPTEKQMAQIEKLSKGKTIYADISRPDGNIATSGSFKTFGEYKKWIETSIAYKDKFRLKDDFKKATGMEISDAQEKQIMDLNQEIFGDQDIKIMGQILTPDGQKALGSYRDGMISILGGKADAVDTFYHEAVHKYFDVFTTKEDQVKLLLYAKEKYGTPDFQATEEKLAEDFINYAKDKKGEGLDVKIREIFDKIIESIKKYFGSEDKIKKFYDDLLSGVAKQKEAKMQEYRNIAQNLPPVDKMASIKDVKTSLSNIKNQIEQLTTTAKGIATLAQEQRAGLNTKDIAKLKRIYAKSTKFQEGDLETIRNSNTGTLLNNVIEDIQTKYPDLNEQEAFDFALNLPNKANESIKNTPQLRTLREQKKSLDSYMELLKAKETQLQGVASESTYNEWQSVMNAQEELAKVVEVPRYNLPVEGAGKEKVSRLEARMKGVLKNASPEMIDQLGLSTFNQLNKDENIAKASEYVLNNPEEAMRVLSGEIPAPKGILNNAIFVAMERMSVGDVNLARKLASLASTRAGQEIGILSEIDSNSPVKVMRDLIKVREQTFAKKFAGRSVAEVKKDVVKKIKENIKPPTKDDWSSFIDSIEC